jgi:hypothetical protein
MIKVALRLADHGESLHHCTRAAVRLGRKGDDLRIAQAFEPQGEKGVCGFGGIAGAPGIAGEAPADLDFSGERVFR